jgi:arylsulfatase A-like enzyme
VLNVDFASIFVELAGATVPPTHTVNGRSLVPSTGTRPSPTTRSCGRAGCSATTATICTSAADCPDGETCHLWKYVEYETGESEPYDQTADPYELTNRSADPALATLRASLAASLQELCAQ